jgi:hypothetical protein
MRVSLICQIFKNNDPCTEEGGEIIKIRADINKIETKKSI